MALSEQAIQEIREVIARYPVTRSALVPALHIAQHDAGWLSPEVIEEIAEELNLTTTQVMSVGTFYTMFYFKPRGKYELQVCTSLACLLRGCDRISECVKQKLGVNFGETTPDNRFTLIEAECLAACGGAPCLWVEGDYYENVSPEMVEEILSKYK